MEREASGLQDRMTSLVNRSETRDIYQVRDTGTLSREAGGDRILGEDR